MNIHIFGGGTISHVRPHLAICAPAYGSTAKSLDSILHQRSVQTGENFHSFLHLTKMADPSSYLETNADVATVVQNITELPETKVIFMTTAFCDYTGSVDGLSGKDKPRLKTSHGEQYIRLSPTEKIISQIRKNRKDIFLVGFKTTAGASPKEQYEAGLTLLKKSSCNLVLANDLHTRSNMIITPEQARYHETTNRTEVLQNLVDMTLFRSKLNFTRSEVIDGEPVSWFDERIPNNLRSVVDHCIAQGAYKRFLGSTVGHFAVKVGDGKFLTSRRKTDFNDIQNVGMVLVETQGEDRVIAHGSRPSVGGQSQRIVFAEHPDTDCIVHFHCPIKADSEIPVRSQRELECGSHQCGQNTSSGLKKFDLESGSIYAVMLDKHGPNLVFNRNIKKEDVVSFIERNFDLSKATDGF